MIIALGKTPGLDEIREADCLVIIEFRILRVAISFQDPELLSLFILLFCLTDGCKKLLELVYAYYS